MKKHITIFLVSLTSASAHAGGGATGGATEVTQLLNHIELVAQVGEAVQTTSNTLMTAQATMQMLRQLSPDVVSQMTGLPIDQVEKMAEAYTVMSQATQVYQDAEAVLRKAQQDAARLKIPPSELLRYKAEAAYRHGGIYQQTYEQEQAKLKRLAEVSADVQRQAEEVKSIDANVKGIQFLAGQNVKMQAVLGLIGDSIHTANANAAREAALKQAELERVQKREAELMDAIKRKELEAPPVTRLPLPHEFAKGGK